MANNFLINNLTYRYPGNKFMEFPDFSCQNGQRLLITGSSGSGKTTLLHLLAGILKPHTGTIMAGKTRLDLLSPSGKDRFRGEHIGMIFQKHLFLSGMSIYQNLRVAQKIAGKKIKNPHYLDEILEKLSISTLRSKKPDQLSEGEQQRFSIARALANQPDWVLADEPTSSLDDKNCEKFIAAIDKVGIDTGWIIATHDQRLKQYFTNIYSI
ncbi:MAG: ABC transporter ATP-binding protein [Bacteroidales bacterium]